MVYPAYIIYYAIGDQKMLARSFTGKVEVQSEQDVVDYLKWVTVFQKFFEKRTFKVGMWRTKTSGTNDTDLFWSADIFKLCR